MIDREVGGVSMRKHYEQAAKTTGEIPKELISPEFPSVVQHVWDHFLSIHHGRTYGISGPNPITYVDIDAWCRVLGEKVSPWEIGLLMRLDRLYIASLQEDEDGSG